MITLPEESFRASSSVTRTRYRYDGQMGVEDIEGTTVSGVSTITAVTRTGLGARSVEVISKTTSSGNTLTYPLYDIHGNMVAALSKAGSTYSVGEARTYDAWGQVRSQVGSGGKLRYCGNLGHKQDDESGLIYMRARYYEPTSGRFISEDRERDGVNWLIYCKNNPVSLADFSGNEGHDDIVFWGGILYVVGIAFTALAKYVMPAVISASLMVFLTVTIPESIGVTSTEQFGVLLVAGVPIAAYGGAVEKLATPYVGMLMRTLGFVSVTDKAGGVAAGAIAAAAAYAFLLCIVMIVEDWCSSQ